MVPTPSPAPPPFLLSAVRWPSLIVVRLVVHCVETAIPYLPATFGTVAAIKADEAMDIATAAAASEMIFMKRPPSSGITLEVLSSAGLNDRKAEANTGKRCKGFYLAWNAATS